MKEEDPLAAAVREALRGELPQWEPGVLFVAWRWLRGTWRRLVTIGA